jgi:magnesium and cobalt exporter, CNNM family
MIAGWWLISGIALALATGFFSSLVLSLHTLSRMRIATELQEIEHEPTIKRVRAILDDDEGHAAALAIVHSFFLFATAISMVIWASSMLSVPVSDWSSLALGLGVAVVMLWFSSTLIPMGIADHAGERTVIRLSWIIRAVHMVFVPILPIWRFSDEVVRRLAGTESNAKESPIAVSELRSIVEDNEVEGKLDETERDMLEAVVEFRSTAVEQIMTPRTEINALEYTDDLEKVQAFVDEHGHSRHPVYSENLDHIEGMLYAKDLLKWIIHHGNNGKPFVLSEILREPSFVPETKTVRELLTQLLADQVHIAIILDEYGGTSGLVTMEDIVEEVFGEIQDEYEDPEDTLAIMIDHETKSAQIDARTEIDDANDELEVIGIELPESDDYDTVAGFINTTLGRIPEEGESFNHETMHFEILEAEPTRVMRLRVSVAELQSQEQGETDRS